MHSGPHPYEDLLCRIFAISKKTCHFKHQCTGRRQGHVLFDQRILVFRQDAKERTDIIRKSLRSAISLRDGERGLQDHWILSQRN